MKSKMHRRQTSPSGEQLRFYPAMTFVVLLSICSNLRAAPERENLARTYVPKFEKILKENIVQFWQSKSLDHKNGGYIINFDMRGNLKRSEGTKMIVSQARTMWLFARLVRAGYGGKECLVAADIGYRFLKEKMWDTENGGFYWEVDMTGNKKLKPLKHLYGQSFALYALSEYYMASKKREVLDLAMRLFKLLESRSHDKMYGGYIEFFNEDWTPVSSAQNSYMGTEPRLKLMNTHLHLLEAITTFYRASKLPLARERILELINIESNTVVRKDIGACTDKYQRNWTPRLEGDLARVSYGHDIENIWLLMDACNAAKVSNYPFIDLYRTLFDYSLKYGFDEANGGFYDSGPFNRPADRRSKVWWVQSEVIVSALYMNQMIKDPKYLSIFEKTADFIEKNMVDWKNGEWYSTITTDGNPRGDKANPWKAGYHNGRAMIECLEILKQWRD